MERIYKTMTMLLFCVCVLINHNIQAQDDEVFELEDVDDGITYLPVDNVTFYILDGTSAVQVDLDYFKKKWEAQILDEEGEAVVLETFMIMKSELDPEGVTYMLKAMSADGLMEMSEFIQPQSSVAHLAKLPANAYLVVNE